MTIGARRVREEYQPVLEARPARGPALSSGHSEYTSGDAVKLRWCVVLFILLLFTAVLLFVLYSCVRVRKLVSSRSVVA